MKKSIQKSSLFNISFRIILLFFFSQLISCRKPCDRSDLKYIPFTDLETRFSEDSLLWSYKADYYRETIIPFKFNGDSLDSVICNESLTIHSLGPYISCKLPYPVDAESFWSFDSDAGRNHVYIAKKKESNNYISSYIACRIGEKSSTSNIIENYSDSLLIGNQPFTDVWLIHFIDINAKVFISKRAGLLKICDSTIVIERSI